MLVPDFNTVLYSSGSTEVFPPKVYLKYFHQVPITMTEKAGNPKLLVKGITDSRLFTWIDNPIDTYRRLTPLLTFSKASKWVPGKPLRLNSLENSWFFSSCIIKEVDLLHAMFDHWSKFDTNEDESEHSSATGL